MWETAKQRKTKSIHQSWSAFAWRLTLNAILILVIPVGQSNLIAEELVQVRPDSSSSSNSGNRRISPVENSILRRPKRTVNFRTKEKQILDAVLGGARYDSRIRPAGVNGSDDKSSTIVSVNIYLRSINDIDDYKMEYSVQITFREQWNDERLKFDDLAGRLRYLTLTDPGKVWMPDTFFRNEKTGHFHSILVNNVYVRIFPNGDVLYSIRISLTLACPMDLKLYPMDRQTCSLKIASYGYTTDDITYMWKETDPVQIAQGLSLPRFSIEKYSSSYCNVKTNTGEYSCLSVDIVFKRQFSYYLITIYVPGCMLVIVSWVSFWLDPNAVPARVSLGVTTLLTMSTQTASIGNALPPVAYTKAIDVWQGVCVTFVFSALLEYALVNYALRADRAWRSRRRNRRNNNIRGSGGGGNRRNNRRRRSSGYRYKDQDGNGESDDDDEEDEEDEEDDNNEDGIQSGYLFADRRNSSLANRHSCRLHRKEGQHTNLLYANHMSTASILNHKESSSSSSAPRFSIISMPSFFKQQQEQEEIIKPKEMNKAKRIDVTSRFLFPLIFAIFNVSYWSYYLNRAANEMELANKKEY